MIELIFLSGDWDWVQRLLLTTSINARDLQNNNLAHFAVRSENEDIIQNISLKFPSLLNEKNAKGQTPMNFDFTSESESSYEDETESSGYSYLNVLESSYEDETESYSESYEYESDDNMSMKDTLLLMLNKVPLIFSKHEDKTESYEYKANDNMSTQDKLLLIVIKVRFFINTHVDYENREDIKKVRSGCIEIASDVENVCQDNTLTSSDVAEFKKIVKQLQEYASKFKNLIDQMTVTIPEAICSDNDSPCVPRMR